MPERVTRLDWIFERNPIYFVTARGSVKYVLMPDHLHLFVALEDEKLSLSQWMKPLNGTLSSYFRGAHLSPPYWKKGFFDHVLRGGESYSEKWQYVHENPVRAGLVTHCQEWSYQGEIFDLEFRRDRV